MRIISPASLYTGVFLVCSWCCFSSPQQKNEKGIFDQLYQVLTSFNRSYGKTDYSGLLVDSAYQGAIRKGQNNVPRSLSASALVWGFMSKKEHNRAFAERARYLLIEVLRKYPQWTSTLLPPYESFNLAPTTAYNAGLTAWLLWDKLEKDVKLSIKHMLIEESNYQLFRQPASGFVMDTKAEENCIVPALLVLTAALFPDQENASLWEQKARCFAYHTVTTSRDTSYCGIKTVTVYDNYCMDNHNFGPHPVYMAAPFVHFADAALVYKTVKKTVPWEYTHNMLPLWNSLKTFLAKDFSWAAHNSWEATGLFREVSGATFVSSTLHTDKDLELQLIDNKISTKSDFVEKKTEPVISMNDYNEDWFLNSIVAKRCVVSYLLHDNSLLPPLPLTIE